MTWAEQKLHIYSVPAQPATRYVDRNIAPPMWFRNPARAQIVASCCGRHRWARYLVVRVYYDGVWFSCRPGRGCQRGARK